jgi:hypothetical protein
MAMRRVPAPGSPDRLSMEAPVRPRATGAAGEAGPVERPVPAPLDGSG